MNLKRVIYSEFNEINKLKTVDHLYKKYNWEPVLMAGSRPNKNLISFKNENFPSCILTDSIDIRQAKFDYSKLGQPVPIDAEILSSLSNGALNFLSLLQDPTGNNYGLEERKSYYYDVLKYWNTVIHKLKPDIFVSYNIPHTPVCLSLYLLCKYYYNIDVLFVECFPLLNKDYHIIGTSLEKLDESISKIYNSKEDISLGPDSKKYLESIRSKEAKPPKHIVKDYELVYLHSRIKVRLKELFVLILKTLKNGHGFKTDSEWKKNIKPYYNIKSRMNNFETFFFHEKLRHKNKNLKKIYDNLVTKVDYSKKYIYFASQYQPEVTTTYIGKYYENFFLVLDILSAAIPDDWIIYYKENASIFINSSILKGALCRDKHYYERLAQYKNIKMVSTDISTFDLIDHAQAVSTVTGTVAWEAVVRGVPSISFGSSIWYAGCNSIFSVRTFDEAKEAIKKIVNGYKPDQNDIERYTASIEKVASKNILTTGNYKREIKGIENPDIELVKIAEELHKAYIENYSNK